MNARLLLPLVAAALALAVAPATASAAPFVPGEVLVKYRDDAGHASRVDVQRETGTGRGEQIGGEARRLEVLDGASVGQTVSELNADPRVEYAVPNFRAHAAAWVPNDPGLKAQWNFIGP